MPSRLRQALLAQEIDLGVRGQHVHAANEFLLVVRGRGRHDTNLGAVAFARGDIHFFPRGQAHEHVARAGGATGRSVRFRGDALLSQSEVDRQAMVRLEFLRRRAYAGENRIDLPVDSARRMRDLFARALDEDSRRESGYRCLLKGIALEMIVLVARGLGFRWDDRRGATSRVLDVLEAIERDPTRPVKVDEMADLARLSRSQFHAAFKKVTGTTLMDHVTRIRVNAACRHLVGSRMPIVEVCYESGFESVSRFYEAFKRVTGLAPGAYRLKRAREV